MWLCRSPSPLFCVITHNYVKTMGATRKKEIYDVCVEYGEGMNN